MTELHQQSDGEIIEFFLQTNNKKALSELYKRYGEKIFRKCLAIVGNREVAKDLSHDIFLKAFLKLSLLKEKEKFKYWISAIAYNICIDYLNLKSNFRTESIDEQFDLASDDSDTENKLFLELSIGQLEYLMSKLAQADKLILLMKYQDDMSIKQIQVALEIGESAVKMRLKRAKERLAQLFEEFQQRKI